MKEFYIFKILLCMKQCYKESIDMYIFEKGNIMLNPIPAKFQVISKIKSYHKINRDLVGLYVRLLYERLADKSKSSYLMPLSVKQMLKRYVLILKQPSQKTKGALSKKKPQHIMEISLIVFILAGSKSVIKWLPFWPDRQMRSR